MAKDTQGYEARDVIREAVDGIRREYSTGARFENAVADWLETESGIHDDWQSPGAHAVALAFLEGRA